MNKYYTDIGYSSLNHVGEQLCGDRVQVIEQGDTGYVVVLADGLGSGVKANILSTLTSTIISTMMANNMNLEDCVQTIAATLPVCKVRKIAYSTFSIIRIVNQSTAEIIQYDNPDIIFLRNGKNQEYDKICQEIDGKKIYKSVIHLQLGDTFVMMSDGVVHAGIGNILNYGWQRSNIIDFLEKHYDDETSSKVITTLLTEECNRLYGNEPGDDATVCTIKIKERKPVNLVIGPCENKSDDNKMMSLFFAKEGKHIICGGTTALLASKYLGKDIDMTCSYVDPEIPPTAKLEGVDLVTEGVITFARVLKYAKSYLGNNEEYNHWSSHDDGASLIARCLFEEATDIRFYVGRAMNPAHQNPDLPINFNIKMQLVSELSDCLKKMGKKITVSYF